MSHENVVGDFWTISNDPNFGVMDRLYKGKRGTEGAVDGVVE